MNPSWLLVFSFCVINLGLSLSAQTQPNVVILLADDLGYKDVGCYGGPVKTPAIDQLAEVGVRFTDFYSGCAVCSPSRATLLTGRHHIRTGVYSWIHDEGQNSHLLLRERTIAEILKDRGYSTAHIGKWHLGHAYGMDPLSQGFQDSLSMVGPLYLPEDHPDVVNAKFDTTIDQMIWGIGQYSATFNEGELFAPDKYLTDYYTDEALKVIENNKNRPFFLYLSHWAIHNPLQALRSDVEQMSHMEGHNLQVYSGMIAALDRSVGKVVQKLKELDIHGKTLIIFTSDNGGANYIELDDINKPYRGWKISFFEGGIRVPYIVSWPDKINPEQTSNSAVHHFDIFSTIASAAGIQSSYEVELDGVNLLPYIKNEKTSQPHQTLFWRSGNHQSVLHGKWKYIISKKENLRWLFDTSVDPVEQNNIIENHPEEVRLIEELLVQFNSEQQDPLFPSSYEVPIMIDKYDGQKYEEEDEYIYWSN